MPHPSLKVFDSLPLKERLFVRGRLALAPLEALAARAEGVRILDVGCGHGVLWDPLESTCRHASLSIL